MENLKNNIFESLADSDYSKEEFYDDSLKLLDYYFEEDEEREVNTEIIELLKENNRKDLIETFVSVLDETNSSNGDIPTHSYILTLPLLNDTIKWLKDFLVFDFFLTIKGLMKVYDETQMWTAVCSINIIFEDVLEDVPRQDILTLIEHADKERNVLLFDNFLKLRLEESKEEAERPYWLLEMENLVTHEELLEDLPESPEFKGLYTGDETVEELVDKLLQYINPENYDVEESVLKEDMMKKFRNDKERLENILQLQEISRSEMFQLYDEHIFGILGPCLMLSGAYELNNSSPDRCKRYGGCRMFTCYENENVTRTTNNTEYDIDDNVEVKIPDVVETGKYEELEWYTGQCQYDRCGRLIKYKHWALRMPMETGGWVGCYCSFDCIENSIDVVRNPTRMKLAKYFRELIQNVGIYDRTYKK